MWEVRTILVSAITEALGTIRKGLDQNVQLLPGHRQPQGYRRSH